MKFTDFEAAVKSNKHGGAGRGQGRKPHPDPKVSRCRIMFRGTMWDELEAEARMKGTTINMLVEAFVVIGLKNEI